jgi:hypothetical protein
LFSSAAKFESTSADNFQGRTGQRGSAAIFFLGPGMPVQKKEAALVHGVRGPSRNDHPSGASSPTSKDFQGKTGQRESAANFCFSWTRNASTKKRLI